LPMYGGRLLPRYGGGCTVIGDYSQGMDGGDCWPVMREIVDNLFERLLP
jgi:hypothetical protein